jgi:hypothetical protein
MINEFEEELEALLNKHGWDSKCNTPDFILAISVARYLDTTRIVNKLTEQWEGDSDSSGELK